MPEMISVGMGEGRLARGDGAVLVALGLGSCVAVCLYDPISRLAAMAHAMLPAATREAGTPFRFAESAVPALVSTLEAEGALGARLRVVLAGGAQMFRTSGTILDIGARNVQAAKDAVARARLPLIAADVGGHFGRSVYFHRESGRILVRTIGQGERELAVLGSRQSRMDAQAPVVPAAAGMSR